MHWDEERKEWRSYFTENLIGSEDYSERTEELQESGIPRENPQEGEDPIQHPQFSPHKPEENSPTPPQLSNGIQNG